MCHNLLEKSKWFTRNKQITATNFRRGKPGLDTGGKLKIKREGALFLSNDKVKLGIRNLQQDNS
jgi:hypothetical protein